MDKIIEALSKLLPEGQVKEVAAAVEAELSEAKKQLDAEYNTKLEEAYGELTSELKEAEGTAEKGYQEAFGIITDLRNRLETQRSEFDKALEEGYEEAYQMLLQERSKKDGVESELYEEYDKKLKDMKEYFIDKIDEFLTFKGKEIYEQAKRDISNDPRMVEQKIVLNKVVESLSDYLPTGGQSTAKVDEMKKTIDEVKGQVRILEARNIRLSTENNKLNENLRHAGEVLREHTDVVEKKERVEKAKNVSGRGKVVTEQVTEVIAESKDAVKPAEEQGVEDKGFHEWQVLSGLKSDDAN